MEVTERRGRKRQQLLDDRVPKIERESYRSHSVEKSLWKRLWTCRNRDYEMNELLLNTNTEGKKSAGKYKRDEKTTLKWALRKRGVDWIHLTQDIKK